MFIYELKRIYINDILVYIFKNCLNLLYLLLDIICILIYYCFRVYEVVWDLVYGDLDMDGIFLDRYVYILGRNDDIFNIL